MGLPKRAILPIALVSIGLNGTLAMMLAVSVSSGSAHGQEEPQRGSRYSPDVINALQMNPQGTLLAYCVNLPKDEKK